MAYRNNSDSITRIVRCELRCRAIIKASPDMPPKMLACQRSLTKYSHADITDDFDLARTVLTTAAVTYALDRAEGFAAALTRDLARCAALERETTAILAELTAFTVGNTWRAGTLA
jgi:hypothetical protein